ncbi:MAG TPA: sigma-54 dependent transcriptional regulator, partial [Terriglobia bacterium]|nr:sigma-54 dependent transcriptional regulator [Terriglobia bacterium]
ALNGADAINLIQSHVYDVILLDVKMPRVGGLEVLKHVKEHSPTTEVVMLTNLTDVKTAIETVKLGAYDFVGKPYDTDQLMATVHRALEHRQLVIQKEVSELIHPSEIVGDSKAFKAVVENAKKIAASETYVLIQGESGTGKELFAQLIHRHSSRKDQPFVAVICAAMPDQLLESELFGHEKGSFTSAVSTKQGLVEVADGGTLFLDEVGDISLTTQPKLLRFLETGEFRRVGGTVTRKVDVRIISASNKDLPDEVKSGKFRGDLLFRLNVVSLHLPTLAERKEDIPLLVEHFLARKSKTKRISEEAMAMLMRYDWPGNVRELEHVIEGALVMSQTDEIYPKDFWLNTAVKGSAASVNVEPETQDSRLLSLEELEKIQIEK